MNALYVSGRLSIPLVLIPVAILYSDLFGLASYWKAPIILLGLFLLIKEKLDAKCVKDLTSLLAFLALYLIISYGSGLLDDLSALGRITFALLPLSTYAIGIFLARSIRTEKEIFNILLILATSLSVVPIISNVLDIIDNGFMNNRSIVQLWRSDLGPQNATNISSKMSLSLPLLGLYFVAAKNRTEIFFRKNSIILASICLISALNMSVRTSVFLVIFSIIMVLFFDRNSRAFYRFIFALAVLLLGFYVTNLGKLITGSFIYERFMNDFESVDSSNLSNLPRIFRWADVVKGIWEYPYGGRRASFAQSTYAHNMWLDTGWTVGVIPLAFLLILTVRYLYTLICFYKSKTKMGVLLRLAILLMSSGLFLTFMVEPIMEGYLILFSVWPFMFGLKRGLLKTFT